ncbi:hypothetical protein K504DRAFT_458525 [Pleomassaria siparia CBS 279.74]|uniref:Uncharacterized protein n=1 Tax=Pleomassaria siparia CBS 279.74 TaxID=1314801 RepID=A0A6G1K2P1_9PLEO|nr:hypothetical protein K504DRAFT_458525 [Pleomassaria siparia CBS 279.74]
MKTTTLFLAIATVGLTVASPVLRKPSSKTITVSSPLATIPRSLDLTEKPTPETLGPREMGDSCWGQPCNKRRDESDEPIVLLVHDTFEAITLPPPTEDGANAIVEEHVGGTHWE